MNLANVRSAIGMTIALALLASAAPAAAASGPREAQLLWLPPGTTVARLAGAGLSPGLMSAGLGAVPAAQTYLDLGQGNRVFDSLYDTGLPDLHGDCPSWWRQVEARAASAPAEIVPGLLSRTLETAGAAVRSTGGSACALAAHLGPGVRRGSAAGSGGAALRGGHGPVLRVRDASLRLAREKLSDLGRGDLLIAIARPTGRSDDPLAIGVGGGGFRGGLTSDSTRINGYVLSTDVAPTILLWLEGPHSDVPSEMSGQPIRAEGSVDPAALDSLAARMEVISPRRGPVIGLDIAIWLAALLLVALVGGPRRLRVAVRVVGLAIVYLPLVLLLGAALEPGQGAEQLLVLLLSPLLAATTLVALRSYAALAVAAALTVSAYAVDVIAGSPLTALSLLGPNPGLGVRFYGIGNELEALLAVLVAAGTGAGLTAFAPGLPPRRSALVFLAVGILAAFVFAAGRFGADVGAAIVFPIGAVVAAAAVSGQRRRVVLLAVIAVPFAVLALLAVVDLLSGADAHLTRSVLDASGLGDLADVAQRRLELSAHSFRRPILLAFLPVVLALAVLAVVRRRRVAAWLEGLPALRAGLLGALAATAVGTLANDSGALLLEIGAAYLLVFACFAWAEREPVRRRRP